MPSDYFECRLSRRTDHRPVEPDTEDTNRQSCQPRQHELNLVEGLELLLQPEEQERSNNRFERLHKNARFRYQVSIEELKLDASRGIDRGLITFPGHR